MTIETETKLCKCGAEVEREKPDVPDPEVLRQAQERGELLPMGALAGSILAKIPVVCDECVARLEAEEAAEVERDRLRGEAENRRRRAQTSGLPLDLQGLHWDGLERDGRAEAIDLARQWARRDLRGLILTGPVGAGKTRIAATAAWDMLGRRKLRWTSMPALFARLGAGRDDRQQKLAAELMNGTGPLVLDDLDKSRPTEYGAEQVFAVIDGRITAGAPLLVTTNLDIDELATRLPDPYGIAIASRLLGYCEAVAVDGRDRRLDREGRFRVGAAARA